MDISVNQTILLSVIWLGVVISSKWLGVFCIFLAVLAMFVTKIILGIE